jgi:hypothetical protein
MKLACVNVREALLYPMRFPCSVTCDRHDVAVAYAERVASACRRMRGGLKTAVWPGSRHSATTTTLNVLNTPDLDLCQLHPCCENVCRKFPKRACVQVGHPCPVDNITSESRATCRADRNLLRAKCFPYPHPFAHQPPVRSSAWVLTRRQLSKKGRGQ